MKFCGWICFLSAFILSFGFSNAKAKRKSVGPLFNHHEIALSKAGNSTVLTGFLLDQPLANLVLVNSEDLRNRRLIIHGFEEGTWKPILETPLKSTVLFMDIVSIGGRDRLLFYEAGRISWFDPQSGRDSLLAEVSSSFDPLHSQGIREKSEIPHVQMSYDVNSDNLDDLVLPDVDGFWVLVQEQAGTFAGAIKVGPPPELREVLGTDGYRYDPWSHSRIHRADFNLDGYQDWVFWKEDHFEAHLQKEGGLFSETPVSFLSPLSIDCDNLSDMAEQDMSGVLLDSLEDLNTDGIPDLILFSLEGRTLSEKQSTYAIHMGQEHPAGGVTFDGKPDFSFSPKKRIQIAMQLHDFDHDGWTDLMFTTIDRSYIKPYLWNSLKGFMGDSIYLKLEFFRMSAKGPSDKPNSIKRIKLRFPAAHREPGWMPLENLLRGASDINLPWRERELGAFNAPLLIGDFNGDYCEDLILGFDRFDLRIARGVQGEGMFEADPLNLHPDFPWDEEFIWMTDLNHDGRQDLVMHHQQERDRAAKIKLWIAKGLK